MSLLLCMSMYTWAYACMLLDSVLINFIYNCVLCMHKFAYMYDYVYMSLCFILMSMHACYFFVFFQLFCFVMSCNNVLVKLFYTCMCFLCNSRFKSSLELMLCVIDISTLNKTYLIWFDVLCIMIGIQSPFNILCILKDIGFSLYYRAFLNNMDFMFLLV
jgi:hypothetical protein